LSHPALQGVEQEREEKGAKMLSAQRDKLPLFVETLLSNLCLNTWGDRDAILSCGI